MVGISSACFYPQKTEETVSLIAGLGYARAEFFLNTHSEFSHGFLSELKRMCEASGITPVSVHPYFSFAESNTFFSDYDRRFDDGLELYKKYFYSAAAFGAKFFNLHGAFLQVNMPPEVYAERYTLLRRAALVEGIDLCQENVSRCLCGKADYLKALKDILGEDVSFTLDIKQANRAGEDPLTLAEIMGDKIKLCHINDFDAKNECLLPCSGTFDISKFLGLLKKFGYSGDLITEVYSDNYFCLDEIKASKKRLEKILV